MALSNNSKGHLSSRKTIRLMYLQHGHIQTVYRVSCWQ